MNKAYDIIWTKYPLRLTYISERENHHEYHQSQRYWNRCRSTKNHRADRRRYKRRYSERGKNVRFHSGRCRRVACGLVWACIWIWQSVGCAEGTAKSSGRDSDSYDIPHFKRRWRKSNWGCRICWVKYQGSTVRICWSYRCGNVYRWWDGKTDHRKCSCGRCEGCSF